MGLEDYQNNPSLDKDSGIVLPNKTGDETLGRTYEWRQHLSCLMDLKKTCTIESFVRGEVRYPQENKVITVSCINISLQEEKDVFLHRGFTSEEIDNGILSVQEFKVSPKLQRRNRKHRLNVAFSESGIKVLEQQKDKSFKAVQLTSQQRDAIIKIAYLTNIPAMILDTFGSYQKILTALKLSSDRIAGIDFMEDSGSGLALLYEGGLNSFVRNLQKARNSESPDNSTDYGNIMGLGSDILHIVSRSIEHQQELTDEKE